VARTITPAYYCEVCSKPTSRLLGFVAGLLIDDTTPSSHIAALGYCAAHRDQIPQMFVEIASAKGTIHWQSDEPVELRPAEVDRFLGTAARIIHQASVDAGLLPPAQEIRSIGTYRETARTAELNCRGAPVRTSLKPPAQRPGRAMAWECHGCGAAGMLC
jgi:hypothetical protein